MYELIPDYSHWQTPVNLAVLPPRGITKVLVKGTDGYTQDVAFAVIAGQAVKYGLEIEVYHWWKPLLDPIRQARNLVDTARKALGKDPDGYTVDLEEVPSGGLDHAGNLLKFLIEVEKQTGIRPVIYTRSSFWKLYYYRANGWAGFYPVHMAHYKDSAGPSVCSPWSPLRFYRWQYTDREDGPTYGATSKQVDMSLTRPRSDFYPTLSYPKEIQLVASIYAAQPVTRPRLSPGELLAEFLAQRRRNPRKD